MKKSIIGSAVIALFLLAGQVHAANDSVASLKIDTAPTAGIEASVTAGESLSLTVISLDSNDVATTTEGTLSVSLSDDNSGGIFTTGHATTGACDSDIWNNDTDGIGTGTQRGFCYSNTTTGTYTITATAGELSTTFEVTVNAAPQVTIVSSEHAPYSTIQEAIYDAVAGDTILVHEATYNVSSAINVDKAVTIKSAEGESPVIISTVDGYQGVFQLDADGAVLDGLEIHTASSLTNPVAVLVRADNVIVRNLVIVQEADSFNAALQVVDARSGVQILNNNVTGGAIGLGKATNSTVTGNSVSDVKTEGIFSAFGSGQVLTLSDNDISNYGSGMTAIKFVDEPASINAITDSQAAKATELIESNNVSDVEIAGNDYGSIQIADGLYYSTLQDAVNATNPIGGDVIELNKDVTISEEVIINKPLTINGNDHTLFAQIDNSANDNSNNAGLGIVGVTGGDVTINDLTIDGTGSTEIHDINIFDAGVVTLNGVTVKNATKAGITINGSDVTVNNITTKDNAWGGINIDLAADVVNPATALTVTGTSIHDETGPDIWRDDNTKAVTFSDTENQYSSSSYTHDTDIEGTVWGIKSVTVNNENELTDALSDPLIETIMFGSDITMSTQLNITRSVTINGAGHTLSTTADNGSVIEIKANDVVIKNLIEDADGTTGNRGINIYKVTGILLDNVTAENNAKNGIVVNGSTVTVNNISTANNGWEGIDVDMGGLVTTLASLTVNGTSVHNEAKAAIRIDDASKVPTPVVLDTNNQYTASTTATLTDYFLNTKNIKTSSDTTETSTVGDIKVTVEIPAGMIIKGNTSWDGTIEPPTATTATVTLAGFDTEVTSAIAIGSSDSDLTFDKAVRLTFEGQAGKRAGWYNHAGNFEEIIDTCSSDSQTVGDALTDGGNCKIDVGSDLVVWTRHFTTFVTYTQTSAQAPASSGGGGGGTVFCSDTRTSFCQSAEEVEGEVLGAFTEAERQAQIADIRNQLISLIGQLINMLQAELEAAQAQQS